MSLAKAIVARGIDLTATEPDWYKVGAACASLPQGREIFHLLSSVHPKYNEGQCERKFNACAKRPMDAGYLINRAKQFIDVAEFYERKAAHTRRPMATPRPMPRPMPRPTPPPPTVIHPIPHDYFVARMSEEYSELSVGLTWLFGEAQVDEALLTYAVGATPDHKAVFFYVNEQGKVTEGKIMGYNLNLHRVKEDVRGVADMLRKAGRLPADYRPPKLLFGLHLLNCTPMAGQPVGIVESEKTALIAFMRYEGITWMATGGMAKLDMELLEPLHRAGREVILFPDVDGQAKWQEIAKQAKRQLGMKIAVCRWWEGHMPQDVDATKWDIADLILYEMRGGCLPSPSAPSAPSAPPSTPQERQLQSMVATNPNLGNLVAALELQVVA